MTGKSSPPRECFSIPATLDIKSGVGVDYKHILFCLTTRSFFQMGHYGAFTLLDQTGEKSAFTFPHGAINVAYLPTYLTEFAALRTAVAGITNGTIHKEMIVMDNTVLSSALPGTNYAQRENKALVTYSGDTTGKLFQCTVPCLDLSAVTFNPGGGDALVLADGGAVAAFVAAFETIVRSPDNDAETVTVQSIRSVGRNI